MDTKIKIRRIVVIKFSEKTSGGNILMDEYCRSQYPDTLKVQFSFYDVVKKFKLSILVMTFLRVIYLLLISKKTKDTVFVFTDPLLSFLEFFNINNNLDRLVQSIDEELYDGHPRILKWVQYIIKQYVRFFLKHGKSRKIIYSDILASYLTQYGLEFDKKRLPLNVPVYRTGVTNHNIIVSIMSNPILKNIELLNRIAEDFQEFKFVVLTQKTVSFKYADNLSFKNCETRADLFSYISTCRCHVSVSRKESLGLPILESMAANVPSMFLINEGNASMSVRTPLSFKSYERDTFATQVDQLKNFSYRKHILKIQKNILKDYTEIIYRNEV
jgi:hypothetical protein